MENVKLAGFGKRFLAYLIDGILLSIVLSIVLIPFGGLLGIMGMKAAEGGEMSDEAAVATAAMASALLRWPDRWKKWYAVALQSAFSRSQDRV